LAARTPWSRSWPALSWRSPNLRRVQVDRVGSVRPVQAGRVAQARVGEADRVEVDPEGQMTRT